MFTRTAHAASAVRQALNPACARQVFGEMRPDGSESEDPLRIRFDRIEHDRIYVDLTPSIDAARAPVTDSGAAVSFFMDGYRYAFETRALGVQFRVAAGGNRRAGGLTLELPASVSRQQRRSSFRVSVAAHSDLRVVICPVDRTYADCCPVGARPLRGRMVNLSAGGLCAIVQTDSTTGFHPCDRLFIEFRLPDEQQDFMLSAQVRHVRQTGRRGGALIGMRFEGGIDRPLEPITRSIGQFVIREERRQLRRKR